jgi:non-lysosomal glucosylceramidase
VEKPMIDDGPWAGVPIGGLGSGAIGRTQRGDFARWHLRVGQHVYRPMPACGFSVFVDGEAHVLSTLRPQDGPTAWNWDLPDGAGTYRALFPRAWTVIDWDRLPIDLAGSQLSPVVAGNTRESSYPVGTFEWRAQNPTNRTIRVGLMLSWQALDEDASGTPAGVVVSRRREDGAAGLVLRNPDAGEDPAGEFAIAAAESDWATVTIHRQFGINDGSGLWADFAADGALDGWDDDRPAKPGEQVGGAVAVTFELAPGETRSARFAIAWDFPVMRFGMGRGWYRRYTRFWGREGGRAFDIATEGLARHAEWETQIEAWQAPLLADPARPDWYAMALINELYVLVDGATAWEDGEVGQPPPAEGEGRFAFLECADYPFYNTHDVLFYASWALALLWPMLERRAMRSLIASVPVDDPSRVSIEATGETAPRKVAGIVPHDIGGPERDPWIELNAYAFQDSTRWKDLNSKFVLQLWRDRVLFDDSSLVREGWSSVVMAMEHLARCDRDGDGLPEHEGIPDQTFDTWPMTGPSAYAGGLWIAALEAASRMATEMGEAGKADRYAELSSRARRSYLEKLWNGRYFLYDGSGGPVSDSVMADQLCGQWYADATWLPALAPDSVIRTALTTVVDCNVRGFAGGMAGAVNGTRPDGSVDRSSEQSPEVWPGVTYALAAALLHRGMDEEAWDTARGAVHVTYERGYWFRTPEAWDEAGNFRASIYMRPLSIWAIEHALRSRST